MKKNTLILISLLCLPFSAQAVIWSGSPGQNIIPLATPNGQTSVTHAPYTTGPLNNGTNTASIPKQATFPLTADLIVSNPGAETVTTEDWVDYKVMANITPTIGVGNWLRKQRTRIHSATSGALLFKSPYITLPQALLPNPVTPPS